MFAVSKRLGCAVVAAGFGLLSAAASARASFLPVFTNHIDNTYQYSLRFTVDAPGETLRAGDFLTIYDVAPGDKVLDANSSGTTPSLAFTGQTPALLTGAAGLIDNPTLLNATFTYTGANLSGPVGTVFTFPAGVDTKAEYTGTRTGQSASSTSVVNQGDQAAIQVITVPAAVPEPASVGTLALITTALLARRRRRG